MRKSLSADGRSLHHLTKNFLLLILLFLWSGSVLGQTVVSHTFAATSGTIDSNISFTTQVNSSGTAPAFNSADSTLRLYYGSASPYNGCSITLVPSNGATITAVELTGVSGNTPTMRYSIGTTTTTTSDPALNLAGTVYTVSGLNITSSLKIRNANITNTQGRFTGIKVTYTPGGPTITSSAAALTGFSTTTSTASAQQNFTVSGSGLTANISVAPPTSYEISTASGSGFTSSAISLTQTSGSVPGTSIYVRLKSGLALGAYNGEVVNITSTGASAKTVTLSGDVVRNTITSTAGGDWNTGSTWVGGVVPTSADNVVIATGHTVSLATAVTRDSGVTTTINGSFQLNNGGYAGGTAFTYAATGSGLIFNNGSLYSVGSGNAFWPTVSPPFNVTVNTGSGARLDTPVGAVAGTLTLNGQLDAANAITVNGTLQLNAGGYVSTNPPVYSATSTLLYNTTYGVGTEWTTTGTTAGAGIPNNVTIQNNAAVSYSAGSARGMAGNLNVASGSSLTSGDVLNIKGTTTNAGTLTTNSTANFTGIVTNSGTFNSNGISNLAGNFTNTGTLNLSSNIGNDFYVGGNWTNTGGTFNPNSRAVVFNAPTGTQTIINTAGETFDYLSHNGAGLLKLNYNVTVKGNAGDVLQLLAGTIDLNAKSLTLSGSAGNVKVVAGQILNSVTAGATFNITNGTKTITGGTLSIPANVTTVLNSGIDFGSNLTTIAGTLRVATGGFVSNNAPIYASASTLEYNGVTSYGVNNEWTGNAATAGTGVPHNVTLTNASVNMPATARGMAGTLTIGSGSTLNLSTNLGADLSLAGNFTKNGTFTPNERAVIFNGGNPQSINGATTFDFLIINKTADNVTLASSIVVNKNLTLTNRFLITGANNITLPNKNSVITASASSYINTTVTGKLIRQGIDNTSDWVFPVGVNTAGRYTPITVKNLSATTELQVSANTGLTKVAAVPTSALLTEWRITSSNAVTANLRADWTAADNGSVTNPDSGDLGVYNATVGSNYVLYDVTLAQYNTEATNVSLANTGVNSILIGNDDAIMVSNDECAGAKTVTVNGLSISGTNTGTTTSTAAICGGSVASDVWYKFTTSDAGSYKVSVIGASGVDPVLNLYSGTCGALTSLACVNATASAGTEFITQSLSANTTYYYRVYTLSALYQGAFTTSVATVPTITVNPTSLAFGDVSITTDSTLKTFTAKASLLTSATGNINLTAPTSYQLSLDGITAWSSILSLPFTGSTLAETTVYVKLNPSDCGTYSGNITATGGGAATANIAVTGKGIIPVAVAAAATDITATTFAAHWNAIAGATGYLLDVYQRSTSIAATEAFNNPNSNSLTGWTYNNVSTSGSGASAYIVMSASNSAVTSIAVDLTDYTTKKLNFKARTFGGVSAAKNIITVSISVNNGANWTVLGSRTPLSSTLTDMTEFDLAAYTGTQVKIRFQTLGADGSIGSGISNLVLAGNKTTTTVTFANNHNPKIISGGSKTSEVVTGLSPNTQYYYTVRATTATCESVKSNEIGILTNNTVVWNAGAWSNGTGPDATLDGIIKSTYSVGDAGQPTFTVKNLTVENTGLLEIKANKGITVTGNINTADNKIVIDSDGSLLQSNTAAANGNSGKITAKRDVKMRRSDYTYWSTPVTGQKLLNDPAVNDGFSVGTPNNRIFEYLEPTDGFKATLDASFNNGKGYAIRGKDVYDPTVQTLDQNLKFVGLPNSGSLLVDIQKSKNTVLGNPPVTYEHGYNMIGNPYPSNINFIQFYNLDQGNGRKNSDFINAKAWFWTNASPTTTQAGSAYSGNNYAIITLAGGAAPTSVDSATGTPTPNEFIKVGQGFIVEMLGVPPTGSTPITAKLKFDNSVRTNNSTGHFYNNNKSTDTINRYWVKLVSPENIVNTILVAHMDGATNNYDANYDAELLTVGDDSFYSKLNTQKLQIQARSNLMNNDDIIPLGTKYAANGNYKIHLERKEGIFETDQKIYLKDKLTNTYTDLTANDYSFAANKGTDENRFEIVYKNNEVLGTNIQSHSEFEVYKEGTNYIIRSSKSLGKIEVYDTSGRLLINSSTKEKAITIDASALPNGLYIIKAENSGDIKTRKVIR